MNQYVLISEGRMVDKNIYIVQGEIGTVVGAIKRNSRWNTHTPLVLSFNPLNLSLSIIIFFYPDLSEVEMTVSCCNGIC